MKILVTGGTGNVGGAVVNGLVKRGAEVRVLARKQPEKGKLAAGVEVAVGDLLDPVAVEKALQRRGQTFPAKCGGYRRVDTSIDRLWHRQAHRA